MASTKLLVIALTLFAVPLAGCFGSDGFDFEPGMGFKETGRTVHLRMWVEDLVDVPIYPGFNANLWAFCAAAKDPNDAYSVAAIEYRDQDGLVIDAAGNIRDASEGQCSVPGPQLRVKQGDRVIVDFENNHFHPHTIHWHGQFVPWESDGVPGSTQESVTAGNSFRYDFIAKRAGTLWYHCHVDTQFHVMQGLYGVIIVEPQETEWEPKGIDNEYTLVYSNLIRDQVETIPLEEGEEIDPHANHRHGATCGASGIPGCQNPPVEADPDVFLLNGHSFPNTAKRDDTLITLAPGERVRLRILNAGPFSIETLHPHGHDLLVTHKDGNPLPPGSRYWVDTLTIGPGERYDVVLEGHAGREGIWVFHSHITSHVTNDGMYPGGALTKIVYPGFEDDHAPYAGGAELPGGVGYKPPLVIPADFMNSTTFAYVGQNLPAGVQADAAWSFDVTMPCAARSASVMAKLDPGNAITGAMSEVTVQILNPDGSLAGELSLDASTLQDTLVIPGLNLTKGAFPVTATGRIVDANLELSVFVDYFESEGQLYPAGRSC